MEITTVVTNDAINFGIPSRMGVRTFVVQNHDVDSWRTKVHKFFDTRWVQTTLMSLLCLDILIIFVELFLMSIFPECKAVVENCVACCPGSEIEDNQNERWLTEDICEGGYNSNEGNAACDEHKYPTVHAIENVLFWCTISILVIFLVENLVEIAALGVCKYFKQVFLAVDFAVVLISLVFELISRFDDHLKILQYGVVLIFFRIWRFVRVGHGIAEVASELTAGHFESLVEYAKECEKKLEEHTISKPEKTKEVADLMENHHNED